MKLKRDARIHLDAAVRRRQLPPGWNLHHVTDGQPRLHAVRKQMKIAMRDGDKLGPGDPPFRFGALKYIASAVDELLAMYTELLCCNIEELSFQLLRSVEGGAAQHDRHPAADRTVAR